MAAGFCMLAALLCLALAAHPFITYPLTLAILKQWRARKLQPALALFEPRVAVCICAYNEASVIAARLDNLLAARTAFPDLEILVYVDGASDETADIVKAFGDDVTLVHAPERHGKTHGMNVLVSLTSADIVVFSDANVSFAPDAIAKLVAPFADPNIGCACGHLRYIGAEGETAAAGSLYWRLEETIKALESATGSVMGADGSIFAIRRRLHVTPPAYLIDDMFVSLSLLCGGARIVRVADAYAYEASVATAPEEFVRKIRIACQAFNVHRALWPALRRLPWLDLYKYVSHKLLRWFVIFFLAGAAAFGALALVFLHAFLLLACAAGLTAATAACVALAPRGPGAKLREILAAFTATGIGVLRSMRGEKFQTWTPPASARVAPAFLGGRA